MFKDFPTSDNTNKSDDQKDGPFAYPTIRDTAVPMLTKVRAFEFVVLDGGEGLRPFPFPPPFLPLFHPSSPDFVMCQL